MLLGLIASFIREPLLSKIRLHSDFVLFITKAKAVDVSLYHQLPQALGEMYACSVAVKLVPVTSQLYIR